MTGEDDNSYLMVSRSTSTFNTFHIVAITSPFLFSENLDPDFLLKTSSVLGAAADSVVPTGIFNEGKETRNRVYRELQGEHM